MYQVEFVLVEPGILCIIDNEFEVGRDAVVDMSLVTDELDLALRYSQRGLSWTEIDTSDLALRMLISYGDC
jgi:hypothetical protein